MEQTHLLDTLTMNKKFTYVKRKISLAASKATLYVKGTTKIKAKGAIGTPSYKSSNAKVAKVDKNGLVTALKKGTAVITVSANGVTLKCKVTVKK